MMDGKVIIAQIAGDNAEEMSFLPSPFPAFVFLLIVRICGTKRGHCLCFGAVWRRTLIVMQMVCLMWCREGIRSL